MQAEDGGARLDLMCGIEHPRTHTGQVGMQGQGGRGDGGQGHRVLLMQGGRILEHTRTVKNKKQIKKPDARSNLVQYKKHRCKMTSLHNGMNVLNATHA